MTEEMKIDFHFFCLWNNFIILLWQLFYAVLPPSISRSRKTSNIFPLISQEPEQTLTCTRQPSVLGISPITV